MLPQLVFNILHRNKGEVVSGAEIAEELNISREMVRKIIEKLKADEVEIETVHSRGYRYIGGHILSQELIKSALKTQIFGQKIEIFDKIDSTNPYLKNLTSTAEGQTVIAAEQTLGKGRFNRDFHSPKHGGLYLSMRFAPKISPAELQFITVIAACAVCRAIATLTGVEADVKWVNDIFYNNRKLCGISTEVIASAENFETLNVVVGVGINTKPVGKNLATIATSTYDLCGRVISRNDLAAELLNNFEELYFKFINRGKAEILHEYKSRQMLFGRTVTVHFANEEFVAKVVSMNENAALIVRDENEKTHILTAGEVSLKL